MTEPIEAGIRGLMHQFREFVVALRLSPGRRSLALLIAATLFAVGATAVAQVRLNAWNGRSRRGGGWNWVGVVSGLFNPNDSGVRALERRPRHDEGYHEGGGCGRRSFAFG